MVISVRAKDPGLWKCLSDITFKNTFKLKPLKLEKYLSLDKAADLLSLSPSKFHDMLVHSSILFATHNPYTNDFFIHPDGVYRLLRTKWRRKITNFIKCTES